MRTFIFWLLFILQPPSFIPAADFTIRFDKPWNPQWTNGAESSNRTFGYRLEGKPINVILTGTGLDDSELVRIENRRGTKVISTGSIQAIHGRFFLRITEPLPDDFMSGEIYDIIIIRQRQEYKLGSFLVAEPMPNNLIVVSRGNLTAGFRCDANGKPYLLSWLSYKDGPNLLDSIDDGGREFQGDLIDGYIHDGKDFRYDTVNQTQGAGDYGNRIPTVESSVVRNGQVMAVLRPLDYSPNKSDYNGTYRIKALGGRYPESGYYMRANYTITANDISLMNTFWHNDSFGHQIHQFRPVQVFLNPLFWQNHLRNENKRDMASWLSARINDDKMEVYSKALGLKLTFRATVDNRPYFLTQRSWNLDSPSGTATPGNVDIWESLVVSELNKMVYKSESLVGRGIITITEADYLGVWFDTYRFKNNLIAKFREIEWKNLSR